MAQIRFERCMEEHTSVDKTLYSRHLLSGKCIGMLKKLHADRLSE